MATSASQPQLPRRYVEIVMALETDYWISGIAAYLKPTQLLTLSYLDADEEENEEGGAGGAILAAPRPELHVLDLGTFFKACSIADLLLLFFFFF